MTDGSAALAAWWDEAVVSVFRPVPAVVSAFHPDHPPVDFHSQDFQDLFQGDSRFPDPLQDDSHSQADSPNRSRDDFHSVRPDDIPEFQDANLRDSRDAQRLAGPDGNPADHSQDDCTRADSPTSVVDS